MGNDIYSERKREDVDQMLPALKKKLIGKPLKTEKLKYEKLPMPFQIET